MNYPTVNGQQIQPQSCGRLAIENRELAFWQSRIASVSREPLRLVRIPELAAEVRSTYPKEPTC